MGSNSSFEPQTGTPSILAPKGLLEEGEFDGAVSLLPNVVGVVGAVGVGPNAYATLEKCLSSALDYINNVTITNSPTLIQQIESFCKFVDDNTAPNKQYMEWIVKEVEKTTHALWPYTDVKPYGSYVTGLSLPSSDLDLVISNVEMSNIANTLGAMADLLAKQTWVVPRTVNPISSAKVPVIKMRCLPPAGEVPGAEGPAQEVVVDITFTTDGFVPKHTGVDAATMLLAFFPHMPLLKPLSLVLKQFLVVQSLHDTYKGGLSSFCLVVMIASFLQAQESLFMPNAQQHTVSSLLLAFLDFYGCQFDYQTMGIRVVKPSAEDQTALRVFPLPRESHTLFIEDPFDPTNNIGQSVFQMWRIALAFKQAFHTLTMSYSLDLLTNGGAVPGTSPRNSGDSNHSTQGTQGTPPSAAMSAQAQPFEVASPQPSPTFAPAPQPVYQVPVPLAGQQQNPYTLEPYMK